MEFPCTLYHETEGSKTVNTYEEASSLLENFWTRKPTYAALSQRVDELTARVEALEKKPVAAKAKL